MIQWARQRERKSAASTACRRPRPGSRPSSSGLAESARPNVSGSVLIYVQYLLGIGHLQRARWIAEALARDGVEVTLVCGGQPIAGLESHPRIRFVQLEPVRARDARFALIDSAGNPLDDALRQRRRAALLDAFASAKPHVVVIEGFPFARRAFCFELDPLIAAARAS